MALKSNSIHKERVRALGDILLSECRIFDYSPSAIEAILNSGASIDYKHSAPLKVAAKSLNFSLVRFLIQKGATLNELAVSFIAGICDSKGYCTECEPQFFELLQLVKEKIGYNINLYIPYINSLALKGDLDKLVGFLKRFSIGEKEAVDAIYIRIIFEIINNGCDSVLAFIEKHRNWIDERCVELCTSCDEWMSLEYIIVKSNLLPSEQAVAEAVYLGNIMTLNVLLKAGYNFNKPIFIQKAKTSKRPQSLQFLHQLGITT